MAEPALNLISDLTPAAQDRAASSFEEVYIRLRSREGRIYTDEELLLLPQVFPRHRHYKEWKLRKTSAEKLKRYLEKKNRALSVLEAGCGNGWLSRFLSAIPLSNVTGTDINRTELLQAKRVFGHVPRLHFVAGGIEAAGIAGKLYDCVVFASSIQYFRSLKNVLEDTLPLIKPGGEIHILDSPFYRQEQLAAARAATKRHFIKSGFPEMTDHYFHHGLDELNGYSHSFLFQPGLFSRYIQMNKNPFPWICIKKA
ncbi:MAG: methyltransferase domain-containing protein [Chitinophagaceae bacterium]